MVKRTKLWRPLSPPDLEDFVAWWATSSNESVGSDTHSHKGAAEHAGMSPRPLVPAVREADDPSEKFEVGAGTVGRCGKAAARCVGPLAKSADEQSTLIARFL
jgi:hypothetical protein